MPRQNRRLIALVLALALPALGAAGCGSTTTTPTTPTTPAVTITETFTGTVAVGGAAVFSFGVTATGNVTATYKSISPDSGVAMGLALGTWNGSTCSVVITNDNAFVNSTIIGAASAAGDLCVRAYDIGKLGATQTVELSVTHF